MSVVALRPAPDDVRPVSREPGWWGMLLFVTTEAALFLVLLAAYFYVRVRSGGDWPQGDVRPPALTRPSVMTALLFVSSAPAVVAEQAARRGNQVLLRGSLLAVLVLGVGFLALGGWDLRVHLDEFTPHTNAYGSLFYTISGLHSAHVAVGLLLVLWTLLLAAFRRVTPARNLCVQNVALYWHFANLSWLAVFASLYLSVSA
jgi:heme/copper-type cytochrome/quinol oxidase subunit 3